MFSWLGYGQGTEKQQNEDKSEKLPENENQMSSDAVENKNSDDDNATQEKESSNATQSELDYAKDMAKNVGSFLFSMASAASSTALKVKDTMEHKSILGEFTKEQEKFIKEKHKRKEAAVAPWVGYNEEESMKSQILALSTDERNFLRDPPSGVQFYYEHDNMFPVALATLEEDENLQNMRFNLVPKKVKEERFWRNYFYRVSLIKQSTQLTSLAASGSEKTATQAETTEGKAEIDSASTPPQVIPARTDDSKHGHIDVLPDSPTQHEFISDDFVHQDTHHELSREDLQQIGMDRKEQTSDTSSSKPSATKPIDLDPPPEDDIPEWEKELQQELQDYEVVDEDENGEWEKEIEDMLEAES
ncbi:synapse-associated protein 1 isoform X2 [Exaiptasia diaphana]|uniref:BSD domain-containing protein n=1 Tax=Exaiptasia diaphana TaxID=2652724 RepID=A0A913XVA5_EXADI|nr:synapse-associated protein 1 isoform X2 [Exaiptasia diaphana]